jgi:HEAT repeat protein
VPEETPEDVPEGDDDDSDDGGTEEPTPPPTLPRPPGGTGPGFGGGVPGGLPGADGPAAGGSGYKGFDRWEYWWEYNKDRFLARRPDTLTDAPDTGERKDPFAGLREKVLLPALRKAANDRRDVIRAGAMLSLGKVGDLSVFSDLYRGVKDKSSEVRMAACMALGYLRSEEVAPVLMRTLLDRGEDEEVRAFAAAGLGLIGAPAGVSTLAEVLNEVREDADVRGAAALALGLIDDDAATKALMRAAAARRDDHRVRALAVSALGTQSRLGNAVPLVNLLRDRSVDVRRSAALALGAIDYTSAAAEDLRAALERKRLWMDRESLTPEAREILEETIDDLETAARREQARVDSVRDGVVSRLVKLAEKEPDLQMRAFALMSLAEIGAPAGLVPIRKILDRKSHRLTAWAGIAAGVSGEEAFVPYLNRVFDRKGKDPSTRAAMAIGLGLLKDRGAAPKLLAVARDPGNDPDLRGYAVMALGMMWEPETRTLVAEIFDTKGNPSMHRSAAVALGLVGSSTSGQRLVSLMEGTNDLFVKAASTIALGYLRDTRTAEALAAEAADAKKPFLARLFSVLAVGYLGDRKAAPPALSRYAWQFNYRVNLTAVMRITSLL